MIKVWILNSFFKTKLVCEFLFALVQERYRSHYVIVVATDPVTLFKNDIDLIMLLSWLQTQSPVKLKIQLTTVNNTGYIVLGPTVRSFRLCAVLLDKHKVCNIIIAPLYGFTLSFCHSRHKLVLFNILRKNRLNETKFCIHIIIDKIYVGIVNRCVFFPQICKSYGP